jgi:hypothetical protein
MTRPAPQWEQVEPGWWVCRKMALAVCLERDRRWHSYIMPGDTVTNSPRFRTMKQAMQDAELRAGERVIT